MRAAEVYRQGCLEGVASVPDAIRLARSGTRFRFLRPNTMSSICAKVRVLRGGRAIQVRARGIRLTVTDLRGLPGDLLALSTYETSTWRGLWWT